MVSNMLDNIKPAAILLAIILAISLSACGGGGSVTAEPVDLNSAVEAPAAVPQSGFGLATPGELFDLVEPGREVSAVKDAGEFETGLPVSQVTNNGLTATMTPQWSPENDPPLLTPAYCFYAFNIGDYTGPGNLTLTWAVDPFLAYNVWAGIGNRDTGAWDWTNCATSFSIDLAEVDPYATPTGDVLVAVLMTGTFDATLASVNFAAGDNEAPVASLVIPAGGGSTNGPTLLDASGSTDSDGTIATYQWDYDGDGAWDETAGATVNHTFATSGRRDVSVRVTDNRGDTDTASVNIGVYDEEESNDDGSYSTSTFTEEDLAAANTLPVVDFSGFAGNCGEDGFGDDREDFYKVNIPAAGFYTFNLYFIDDDANLDLAIIEDIGGGGAELEDSTSINDNESIIYEFTYAGDFYLQVYAAYSSENADYTLEALAGSFIAPNASFTATPDEGDPGLVVSFDAAASSDDDGSVVLYEWDYDGDGTYDHSATSWTTTHTYNESGGFEATLRVTDDDGLTDTATHTIVVYGDPPVADLQANPSSGTAPLTVSFDATGTTPLGSIETYRWDWDNDGSYETTGTEPIEELIFYGDGSYTVVLQVEDYEGRTDEASVTITVNPPTYSETEVNDTYTEADVLPALDFTNWTGIVGPVDEPSPDPEDWSSFTVPGPGEVRIYMELENDVGDIDIALFDTDGTTELDDSILVGDWEEIEYHLEAAGTYFIQVYMYTGSSSDKRGGYVFLVEFTAD